MLDYLAALQVPTLVVLTKVDKLKSSQRDRALRRAREKLGIDAEQLVPVSSRTGEGRDTLLAAVSALLEDA